MEKINIKDVQGLENILRSFKTAIDSFDETQKQSVQPITMGPVSNATSELSDLLGWGNYVDGTYTEGSPLAILADTDTILENDAANSLTNETQKPSDITTFYVPPSAPDDGYITGKNGDSYLITVDFKAKPSSAAASRMECWFDIGGAVGELYRRNVGLDKGSGVEQSCVFSTAVYTLDTWETNGAKVFIRSNGPVDIYEIRFIIYRLSKARV